MKIIEKYPPNFKELKKVFKITDNVVFTYGDILFNPSGGFISDDLKAHEETHSKQQGLDPASWWDKYLKNSDFRLKQEVEAYQNQYRAFKKTHKDRNKLARFLHEIACALSSELYGNIVDYQNAVDLIK